MELQQQSITTPSATSEDRITHGLNTLTGDLTDVSNSKYDAQLQAIIDLCDASAIWSSSCDTP